ncbi:hypothetical protein [Streptomyces sp. NPDC058268]|uniref:hypothetical protein n=1 Tax=Streptomyces sp. NPDC058268 TaxID=3346413 RepID=UPI0036E91F29
MLAFLDCNTTTDRAELLCLDHARGTGIQDVYEWQLLLAHSTLDGAAHATAAESLLPEKPSGDRYTRGELAELLGNTIGVYFPLLAILADPDQHKAVVVEAGAALGRRPPQQWPPAAGGGRHLTLWLTRPVKPVEHV